jgi:hypothetical protein
VFARLSFSLSHGKRNELIRLIFSFSNASPLCMDTDLQHQGGQQNTSKMPIMNTSTKKNRINDDSCSSGVCILRRYHLALILFSVLAVASVVQVHQFQPSTATSTTADRVISIISTSSSTTTRNTGLEDYNVSPIVGGLRATPSFTSTCRYYLDESALPNGGLGVFTAVGIHKDDPVGAPPYDVCIYVADTPSKRTAFTTHSWGRDVFHGGTFEGHNPRTACGGFATLYNAQPAPHVANISPRVTTNAGLHRATHPGAGAITSYFGITSKSDCGTYK